MPRFRQATEIWGVIRRQKTRLAAVIGVVLVILLATGC